LKNLKTYLFILIVTVSLLMPILVMLYTDPRSRFTNMSQGKQSELMYIRVETDKHAYKTGEKIQIIFYIVNNESTDMFLPSLSRGLDIFGPSGVVLLLVESYASEGPIKIAANSEYLLGSLIWNQRDMNGKEVPEGTYKIHVNLLDAEYEGEASITIE